MKNTGIEYLSTECKPHVLEELATLLPPLSEEQRSSLEADLLTNGCYSPIVVNEDMTIVDGHNRQQICEAHDIPYRMLVFSFNDLLEAKEWMVSTQRGRRNLQPWELGKIALKLKDDVEAHAKANRSASGGDKKSEVAKSVSVNSSKPISPVDTRKELARAVGLGEQTMGRVLQIDEHAPNVVKEALDSHELSVNQGYNITKKVQQLPEEEREQAALEAIEMEKAKKDWTKKDAETDRRTRISKLFSSIFQKACRLEATEEYVRCWTDCARMRPDEMALNANECRELAQMFLDIANIIETKIIPTDWRTANETEDPAESGN